jgi:alkylation response protein AidB-like acyl-CoA dehydrogenase
MELAVSYVVGTSTRRPHAQRPRPVSTLRGGAVDVTFTPQQQAFRAELRSWFEANQPTARLDPPYTDRGLAQHLRWERTLFDAGYAAPGWPKEVGGLGADVWGQLIYDEEYARLGLPERVNKMGLIHGGPTIIAHGTDEQRQRWLPGILSCDDIWCQGFSEPEAGSDLTSLRTSARRAGDKLVLNGQKIWTSQGTIASTMFALVRTNPDLPGSRGLTFVVLDLRAPGVEVRPLVQLHGHAGFAEVFFTDVEVPIAHVVGAIDDGWRVAQTSLELERGSARGNHTRLMQSLAGLAQAVRDAGTDTASLQRLGDLHAWAFAYEQATYAAADEFSRGEPDRSFSSIMKLRWSQLQTAIHEEHLAVLGPAAEVLGDTETADGALLGRWHRYWHGRAAEIFAGANEIQRNIIAERILRLPREPRG